MIAFQVNQHFREGSQIQDAHSLQIFEKHIKRFENAATVMATLGGPLSDFHKKVKTNARHLCVQSYDDIAYAYVYMYTCMCMYMRMYMYRYR
jgi:hypothetical protein